jgi:hypothetical protein
MTSTVRNFTFSRDSFYVYKNTCLLKWLRVRNIAGCTNPSIIINGVRLAPTCIDKKWITWDFSIIRDMCRDEVEDNNIIRLSENFRYNTFEASSHYDLSLEDLESAIFTSGLQIALWLEGPAPTTLEAQEEVYLSKMQTR